jgi:uncharacterized membrane protein YbhN (UPF0104 family)
VRGYFTRLDPAWIAAAVAALGLQIVIGAIRWARIASDLGAPISVGRATRVSAIAAFLNQALPSTVGGDAMRIWLLGRTDRRWKAAIFSVILDRVAGVAFLAVIVAACLPWSLSLITAPTGRAAVLVIGLGGVAAIPVIFVLGLVRPGPRLRAWRVVRSGLEVAAAARAALFRPNRIGTMAVLSIVIHMLTVACAWFLAKAIAVPPDPMNVLILIPPVMLVSMVPVSIGGWGIREGTMVLAFSYAGIGRSEALSISVLMGLTSLLVGVAGGLFWIAERNAPMRIAAVPARTEPHA